MVLHLCHSNYQAPVTDDLKRGIKVLDVGCGTGIWSIELAKEFPNSTFTGTDITNVFMASELITPSNCTFLEANTLKGLPFDDNTFDFVFQRYNVACFKIAEYPVAFREIVRVAKPGSYIESMEGSYPTETGPALTTFVDWLKNLYMLRDMNLMISADPNLYIEAGFTDLVSSNFQWCLGWGPDPAFAEICTNNYFSGLKNTRPQVTTALGLSEDEFDEVIKRIEEELTTPNDYRPFVPLYNNYGRKALQN